MRCPRAREMGQMWSDVSDVGQMWWMWQMWYGCTKVKDQTTPFSLFQSQPRLPIPIPIQDWANPPICPDPRLQNIKKTAQPFFVFFSKYDPRYHNQSCIMLPRHAVTPKWVFSRENMFLLGKLISWEEISYRQKSKKNLNVPTTNCNRYRIV